MRRLKRAFRVLWVAYDRFNRNDGWSMSGFIAFSGLLSIFPFLIFAATLIGILVGTWSTVFLAAPLYSQLREGEPAIRRHDQKVLKERERAGAVESAAVEA